MGVISNIVRQLDRRQSTPLALCRIRLDFASNDPRRPTDVVLQLSLGTEQIGSTVIPAAAIGVPLRYSEARLLRPSNYRLPQSVADFLNQALPPDQPLYLAFDSPYGYLPAFPWERFVTQSLARPVLRLGATAVRPVLRDQAMDIAYCCSLPANSGVSPGVIVTEFIRQLPRELPQQARLHVFTHSNLSGFLERKINSMGLSQVVTIYASAEAMSCPLPDTTADEGAEVSQIQNPWLCWMRDALQHVSIDGVHFVCTGFLGRSRAGLRLSDAPTQGDESRCAEIVTTRELAMFLQQVGAWAVAFSSPPLNSCDTGLRMLFHEISGMVAGPAALHDIAADTQANALGMLYRYVFEPQKASPPASPALALATHPGWTGTANRQWDDRMERFVHEYSLFGQESARPAPSVPPGPMADAAPGTEPAVTQVNAPVTPSWVASQQRGLEKSIAELAITPQSARDQAREDGIREALKFTSNLLREHASKRNDGTQGGTGGGAAS